MPVLKPQGQALFKFSITLQCHEITFLYFFSWKCTWFGQKEPSKMWNFRLSTAHMKFHQLCTLIDSFCWKYVKFQLKKYIAVMSHDSEDWCKIWRKTDLLFQKWQEFGEFWPEHSKVSKICTFIGSYCAKYLKFDIKRYRGVIFHDNKEWCKIWRKTDLCLENEMRNMANFHQSTWRSQNWEFDGVL